MAYWQIVVSSLLSDSADSMFLSRIAFHRTPLVIKQCSFSAYTHQVNAVSHSS